MNALISGQAGVAVLIDGDVVSSIHLDEPDRIPCSRADVPYLLGDATDVEQIDNIDERDIAPALELAWAKDRALHMALILLEGDAEDETRRMAAECLNDFFSQQTVFEFVANRLYGAPLPLSADLVGALLRAEAVSAGAVRDFLEQLGVDQERITQSLAVWTRISNLISSSRPSSGLQRLYS